MSTVLRWSVTHISEDEKHRGLLLVLRHTPCRGCCGCGCGFWCSCGASCGASWCEQQKQGQNPAGGHPR